MFSSTSSLIGIDFVLQFARICCVSIVSIPEKTNSMQSSFVCKSFRAFSEFHSDYIRVHMLIFLSVYLRFFSLNQYLVFLKFDCIFLHFVTYGCHWWWIYRHLHGITFKASQSVVCNCLFICSRASVPAQLYTHAKHSFNYIMHSCFVCAKVFGLCDLREKRAPEHGTSSQVCLYANYR